VFSLCVVNHPDKDVLVLAAWQTTLYWNSGHFISRSQYTVVLISCVIAEYTVMDYLKFYSVIHNSSTHFTKSVHLNGGRDFNMRPIYVCVSVYIIAFWRKTLQIYFYLPWALSSSAVRHGRRLSENGADGRKESFRNLWLYECACLMTEECSRLWPLRCIFIGQGGSMH
jgi:hypothetical protein